MSLVWHSERGSAYRGVISAISEGLQDLAVRISVGYDIWRRLKRGAAKPMLTPRGRGHLEGSERRGDM